MHLLRWTVITLFMLGLPTLAVLGDVQQVTGLFLQTPDSHASVITSQLAEPISSHQPRQPDLPGSDRGSDQQLPAVYPKLKEPEPENADAAGKSLRAAIYRPFAPDRSTTIRRIQADSVSRPDVVAASIKAMENELQTMGAQSYRMDESNGTFTFTCEFAPRTAGEDVVIFASNSTTGESAMQDAIKRARAWQSNVR